MQRIYLLGKYNNKNQFDFQGEGACFNEKTKDKEPIFDKNLKARLYGYTGKILAEDFIRSDDTDSESPYVKVYLPYHDNAVSIHLLKIEDNKEIIFYISSPTHESKLKRYATHISANEPYGLYGWGYSSDTQCFSTRE